MADRAAAIAMAQFRQTELVKNKAGQTGFDPVTSADLDIENLLRDMIKKTFPDHAIDGEEMGLAASDDGGQPLWVLDPIDGTRNYFAGSLFWGILIALIDNNAQNQKVRLGVIDHPPTQERFIAENGAGWWQQGAQTRPLQTRKDIKLPQAILAATTPALFEKKGELAAFNAISAEAAITLYGGNCYFYGLLALGQIDLVIESALMPYDVMALIPIVEAAGGIITDWRGQSAFNSRQIIAAANPDIHQAALAMLADAAE